MANAEWPSPLASNPSGVPPDVAQNALMIDVRGLNKYFGDRHVLNNIDFPVKRGECVAVIGPSGSGKSTLIRCINYLETPTSGTSIDGKTLSGQLSAAEFSQVRRELGMVFYNFNLFPHKSVLDNITLAPIRVRKIDQRRRKKRLTPPAKVGLGEKADAIPTSSPVVRNSAWPSPERWR